MFLIVSIFYNLDRKKTPVASLKSQGSWKVIASNKKVVLDQLMQTSAYSDVQVLIVVHRSLSMLANRHRAVFYIVINDLLSYLLFTHDDIFIFSVFQPIILFVLLILCICI